MLGFWRFGEFGWVVFISVCLGLGLFMMIVLLFSVDLFVIQKS